MNPLLEYFLNNEGRKINKWLHYFDIYHRYFARYINTPVTIMEIGVAHGGSLQMWKHYFGPEAKIIGIDIDPRCHSLEEEQITIHTGDQKDPVFLAKLKQKIRAVDIVIDDGGHMMNQMRASFRELYGFVSEDGIYMVEDLHTCYWKRYGGGIRNPHSFIEYVKTLIDELNAYHSQDPTELSVSAFTKSTFSISIYDSIVVFEKKRINPPRSKITGLDLS